ncbi:MAG: GNAT family N-acetyltransferase [Saprospiraceae bacterium]
MGFCYIETWSHGEFVANSGLIVDPDFRGLGVATAIKRRIFDLSRNLYPQAKIFGLTTGRAVMKINSELGYEPATYSELTQDPAFWAGCQSCVNFSILQSKDYKNCICTAMLYDPQLLNQEAEMESAIIVHY